LPKIYGIKNILPPTSIPRICEISEILNILNIIEITLIEIREIINAFGITLVLTSIIEIIKAIPISKTIMTACRLIPNTFAIVKADKE